MTRIQLGGPQGYFPTFRRIGRAASGLAMYSARTRIVADDHIGPFRVSGLGRRVPYAAQDQAKFFGGRVNTFMEDGSRFARLWRWLGTRNR